MVDDVVDEAIDDVMLYYAVISCCDDAIDVREKKRPRFEAICSCVPATTDRAELLSRRKPKFICSIAGDLACLRLPI